MRTAWQSALTSGNQRDPASYTQRMVWRASGSGAPARVWTSERAGEAGESSEEDTVMRRAASASQRTNGVLIAGTSSDAGKSLVTTGLCRLLARRGVAVTPFKAQNMSNNSMVCADGSEIGRAQYLQAQAAGIEATSAMNPVLLKPGSDQKSFVVLRGRPYGTLAADQFASGRDELARAAFTAYEELAGSFDLIVSEGAGSPAEINLRSSDYVNLGLARRFRLPVVVVGDIDRGGVFAALYGTVGLLDQDDSAL